MTVILIKKKRTVQNTLTIHEGETDGNSWFSALPLMVSSTIEIAKRVTLSKGFD